MDKVAFPNCCGISIIQNLGQRPSPQRLDELIRLMEDQFEEGRLSLIAINEDQNNQYEAALLDRGWRLMSQHTNGGHNSQNFLWGYHNVEENFKLFGEALPPVRDALAEVRLVDAEIYAHLRDFGRRGPFPNVETATQHFPICRQFDRREIMSDGTSIWIEDI